MAIVVVVRLLLEVVGLAPLALGRSAQLGSVVRARVVGRLPVVAGGGQVARLSAALALWFVFVHGRVQGLSARPEWHDSVVAELHVLARLLYRLRLAVLPQVGTAWLHVGRPIAAYTVLLGLTPPVLAAVVRRVVRREDGPTARGVALAGTLVVVGPGRLVRIWWLVLALLRFMASVVPYSLIAACF